MFDNIESLEKKPTAKKALKKSTAKAEKKVHFVSLGCPKNLVDTEIMLGALSAQGYRVVENA
ncbi:MAG: hypothetical protein AABZ31_13575, partial [Bdellovibrionota bacterium]